MFERYTLSLGTALTCLLLVASVHAEEVMPWSPITQAELKMLPPYCAVRLKDERNTPEWKLWEARLGKGMNDVHHYCFALNHLNRYYGASSQSTRRLYLQEAIRNLDYMMDANHSVAELSILPDIYADKGRTLLLQKKNSEAIMAFQKAIELNPGTAAAYSALADIFLAQGDKKKALQYTEDGLNNVPDNPALKRRYKALSGHVFVPPVVSSKPDDAKVRQPTPNNDSVRSAPAVSGSVATQAPVTAAPAAVPEESQKIGTPTNPYCRFCP
jgi:tetratricopeptide (TPR) repeat protein